MRVVETFKIIMRSWGGTEETLYESLTYDQAFAICEAKGWVEDTGYIWDLIIEPMAD